MLAGSLLLLHTMYRKQAPMAICPVGTALLPALMFPAYSSNIIDNSHADLRSHLQVLVGLAKTCPRALAPHLAAIATRVQEMWQQGLLWAGERNVLCDGLVITAGTDSPSVQSQVGSQPCSPMLHVCLLTGSLLLPCMVAFRAAFCQMQMLEE